MSFNVLFRLDLWASDDSVAERLLDKQVAYIPRVGETVVLPVKHESTSREYVVKRVMFYVIENRFEIVVAPE